MIHWLLFFIMSLQIDPLEILKEWCHRVQIRIVINPKKRLAPKQKLEDICHARNCLLDILRSQYSDVTFLF